MTVPLVITKLLPMTSTLLVRRNPAVLVGSQSDPAVPSLAAAVAHEVTDSLISYGEIAAWADVARAGEIATVINAVAPQIAANLTLLDLADLVPGFGVMA